MLRHDLQAEPLALEGFSLGWYRWLTMVRADLEPLLAQRGHALRPGSRAVFDESMHWQNFSPHPAAARGDRGSVGMGPTLLELRAVRPYG